MKGGNHRNGETHSATTLRCQCLRRAWHSGCAQRFVFVPKRLQYAAEQGRAVPEYIVSVQGHDDDRVFTWITAPPRDAVNDELEQFARKRIAERNAWIRRVADLVKIRA